GSGPTILPACISRVFGVPVTGVISTTLKVTENMVDKIITFVTTGTAGDDSQASESEEFGPVKAELAADSKPPIDGTAQVGKTLEATPAMFNDDGAEVSNQWLADGDPITGETGTKLKLTKAQLGKTITFESTATRGDEKVSSTSAATDEVADAEDDGGDNG